MCLVLMISIESSANVNSHYLSSNAPFKLEFDFTNFEPRDNLIVQHQNTESRD